MKLYFYLPYSNALGTNSNTLPNSAIPSQQEAIYQEARKAFFKAVEQKTIAANLKTIQDATRNNYQGLDIAATKQQLKKENASLSFADIHCPEDYINNTGVVVTDITESSVKKLNDFGYSIEKKPDGYVSITHFNESNLNTDDAYAFWNEMLINCIVIGQGTKQRFTLPDETMQLEKRKELPVEFKNKISTHQAPKAAITKKLTLEDYEARAAALQATALSAKISSIQEDYEAQAEALLAAPLSSSDKNEDAQKKPKPMKPASRNPHNFVARHTFDTASDLVIPPETPTTPTILLGSGLIDKLKRSSRPPSTTTPKPAATTAKIQSTLPAIDKDKSLLIQRIKDLNLVNNLNESLKDAGKRLVTLLLYHPTELTLNDFLNHDTTMLREDIEELIYCTKQLIITYIKNLPHLDPEKSFFLNAILDYRPESRMTQTNAFSALFRISTPNGKDSFTELTNERTAMKEAIAREQAENRRKAKIREEADEIKRDQKIQQFLMEQQQQNQNSQKPLSATPQPPVKTSILNSLQKIKPEDTDAGEKLLSELHECQQHFTIEEMLLNDALTKTKQKKLVEHMINNMTDEMAELIADILDRSGKHPTLEQVIWQDFSFFSSTEIKKPEAGKGFPRGSSLAMLSDALEKHRDKYRATAATTNNQQANNAATANNSPVNIDDFFKSLSKLKSGEEIFNAMHEVTKTTHTLPEILAAIKKYLTDKQQTSVAMYIITKLQQNDSEIAKIAENIMELDPLLPILGPFMWYEFSNNPFDFLITRAPQTELLQGTMSKEPLLGLSTALNSYNKEHNARKPSVELDSGIEKGSATKPAPEKAATPVPAAQLASEKSVAYYNSPAYLAELQKNADITFLCSDIININNGDVLFKVLSEIQRGTVITIDDILNVPLPGNSKLTRDEAKDLVKARKTVVFNHINSLPAEEKYAIRNRIIDYDAKKGIDTLAEFCRIQRNPDDKPSIKKGMLGDIYKIKKPTPAVAPTPVIDTPPSKEMFAGMVPPVGKMATTAEQGFFATRFLQKVTDKATNLATQVTATLTNNPDKKTAIGNDGLFSDPSKQVTISTKLKNEMLKEHEQIREELEEKYFGSNF